MSSYHAGSSSLQAFLWRHRSKPACIYFNIYMLHRTAWLAGSVSAMERACVFVCWILWSSLVKRCQVIAHAITLHCSICSQVALSQYHSIRTNKSVFCLRYAVWATALRGVQCGYVLQDFRMWRLKSKCEVWNLGVWDASIEVCAARSEV